MPGAFCSTLEPLAWLPFMTGICAASLAWLTGLSAAISLFKDRRGNGFFGE